MVDPMSVLPDNCDRIVIVDPVSVLTSRLRLVKEERSAVLATK